jgi:hypothetical protein
MHRARTRHFDRREKSRGVRVLTRELHKGYEPSTAFLRRGSHARGNDTLGAPPPPVLRARRDPSQLVETTKELTS